MVFDAVGQLAAEPGGRELSALVRGVEQVDPRAVRVLGDQVRSLAAGVEGSCRTLARHGGHVGDAWQGRGADAFAGYLDQFGRAGARTVSQTDRVTTALNGTGDTLDGMRREVDAAVSRALDAARAARAGALADPARAHDAERLAAEAMAEPTAAARLAVQRADTALSDAARAIEALARDATAFARLPVPGDTDIAPAGSSGPLGWTPADASASAEAISTVPAALDGGSDTTQGTDVAGGDVSPPDTSFTDSGSSDPTSGTASSDASDSGADSSSPDACSTSSDTGTTPDTGTGSEAGSETGRGTDSDTSITTDATSSTNDTESRIDDTGSSANPGTGAGTDPSADSGSNSADAHSDPGSGETSAEAPGDSRSDSSANGGSSASDSGGDASSNPEGDAESEGAGSGAVDSNTDDRETDDSTIDEEADDEAAGTATADTTGEAEAPSATGGPPGQVGDWIREATTILAAEGVPADQMNPDDIATIIDHESSGDPDAINNTDSNAAEGTPSQGLMQTIGPTFDSYKLEGHGEITNPVDNIIAGVRYAIDRYGSVSQVPGVEAVARGDAYVGY